MQAKLTVLFLLTYTFSMCLQAQQSIDGDFSFQTNSAKKYSLYIPSSYDAATPNDLMLGMHPFNTNRWDGEAWRDTLIAFAEQNDLLLVCPDGGPDGRIDGAIDTAFTTALMDSVELWYNINPDQKYITGFSVGGKATYTYGIANKEFRGFIPIGAAITTADISSSLPGAESTNFYVIHGTQDSPNIRYTPIINSLRDNDACVEGNLLSGVGHTIDFDNRNQILTDALLFLKSNDCITSSTKSLETAKPSLFPNPSTGAFHFDTPILSKSNLTIYDANGQVVAFRLNGNSVTINNYKQGIFFAVLKHNNEQVHFKLSLL